MKKIKIKNLNFNDTIEVVAYLFVVCNILLVIVSLAGAGLAVFDTVNDDTPIVETVYVSSDPYLVLWDELNTTERMTWAAQAVANNTYEYNSDDMAISAWNMLNKKGVPVVLIYGNLSMKGEPIMKCNRLWVAADTEGIALDSGKILTDSAHREGYRIRTPTRYREIIGAIDDTRKAETAYKDALNTYNAQPTTETLNAVTRTQIEYSVMNERLVNLVNTG